MTATERREQERRGHDLTLVDWSAFAAPIGLWMVHLTFEASVTRFTCIEPGWRWIMHTATIVLALATIAAILWCARIARRARSARDDGSTLGQLHFFGLLGVGIGVFNLVLILWEGAYVFVLKSCG